MKGLARVMALTVTLCVAWLPGCEDSGTGRSNADATLRDSAGITIADNPQLDSAIPLWTLGDAPVVTLGAAVSSPDDPLYRVTGAARLEHGRIAVANAGTHHVRFYGPDGEFLFAAGREGEGPGEYRSLDELIVIPGDTLVVQDRRLQRLIWLNPDGELVRTVRVQPREDDLSLMFMRLAGLLGDSLVFVALPVRTTFVHYDGSVRTDSVRVLLTGPDGSGARVLVAVLGTETWVRTTEGDGWVRVINMSVPFGAAVHYAAAAGRFYLGRSDRYEVAVYERGPAPGLLIRRSESPRPVTAQDRAAFRREYLAGADGGPRARREREQTLAEIPFAENHAAFIGLVATEDGRLWVREPATPGADSATWAIYGPSGLLEGRVHTPGSLEIQQIGPDFMLALRRDNLGVEHIELWELRPPP